MAKGKRNTVAPKESNKPTISQKMKMPLKEYPLKEDKYSAEAKPSLGKVLFTKEELEDNSKTE